MAFYHQLQKSGIEKMLEGELDGHQNYEESQQSVNEWIRTSGKFDAVIDFDEALRDPKNPSTILPEAHSGDYLHPNELGYKMMGRAIDLSLFE